MSITRVDGSVEQDIRPSQEVIGIAQDADRRMRRMVEGELRRTLKAAPATKRLSWDNSTQGLFRKVARDIYRHSADQSYWRLEEMDGKQFIVAVNDIPAPAEPQQRGIQSVSDGPWAVKSSEDGDALTLSYQGVPVQAFDLKAWDFQDRPALAAQVILAATADPQQVRLLFGGLSAAAAKKLSAVYQGSRTLMAVLLRQAAKPPEDVPPEIEEKGREMSEAPEEASGSLGGAIELLIDRAEALQKFNERYEKWLARTEKELGLSDRLSPVAGAEMAALVLEDLQTKKQDVAVFKTKLGKLIFALKKRTVEPSRITSPRFRAWVIEQKIVESETAAKALQKKLYDPSHEEESLTMQPEKGEESVLIPKIEPKASLKQEAGLMDVLKRMGNRFLGWFKSLTDLHRQMSGPVEEALAMIEGRGTEVPA